MKHFHSLLAATLLLPPLSSVVAQTAPGGSDNAGNYTGQTDYQNVNGGSYFIAGFSGTSGATSLGSSPSIDTAGQSFGLSSGTISRSFGPPGGNPSYALAVGQLFRFQLQSGAEPTGFGYSLTLKNALSSGDTFVFGYTGGATDYTYSITYMNTSTSFATRTVDTGVPFSASGVTVGFTETGGTTATGFSLTVTPNGGTTAALNDIYAGNAYAISIGAGNGATVYFNNLAVVP